MENWGKLNKNEVKYNLSLKIRKQKKNNWHSLKGLSVKRMPLQSLLSTNKD